MCLQTISYTLTFRNGIIAKHFVKEMIPFFIKVIRSSNLNLCLILFILSLSTAASAQDFITWTHVSGGTVYGTFPGGTVTCTSTGIGIAPTFNTPAGSTINLNGAISSQTFYTYGPTINPPSQSLLFAFSMPVIIISYNMHDIDKGSFSWDDGFVFAGINFSSVVTGGGVIATTSGVASGAPDAPGTFAEYAYWGNSTTAVTIFSINYLVNEGLTHAYLGYSMQVSIRERIKVIGDTVVCLGNSVLLSEVSTLSQSWALESDPQNVFSTVSSIYVSPLVTTTYLCFNTPDTVRHTVVVNQPVQGTDLGPDDTICQGESITLSSDNASSNTKIEWQNGSNKPKQVVDKSGVYWLKESNSCGYETDTVNVEVLNCSYINLIIPNLVTPNGDGLNDLFVPIESYGIKSMKTKIYNRWGTKIFETSDLLIQWDSERFSDGVYYWSVQYTDMRNEEHDLKGFVQVLK